MAEKKKDARLKEAIELLKEVMQYQLNGPIKGKIRKFINANM